MLLFNDISVLLHDLLMVALGAIAGAAARQRKWEGRRLNRHRGLIGREPQSIARSQRKAIE